MADVIDASTHELSRWRAACPWIVVAVATINGTLGVVSAFGEAGASAIEQAGRASWSATPIAWAILGALILWRLPRHTIGWLLLLPVADGITSNLDVPFAAAPPGG